MFHVPSRVFRREFSPGTSSGESSGGCAVSVIMFFSEILSGSNQLTTFTVQNSACISLVLPQHSRKPSHECEHSQPAARLRFRIRRARKPRITPSGCRLFSTPSFLTSISDNDFLKAFCSLRETPLGSPFGISLREPPAENPSSKPLGKTP